MPTRFEPTVRDLEPERLAEVMRLQGKVPVIDCHNDSVQDVLGGHRHSRRLSQYAGFRTGGRHPAEGQIDFPRALAGGMGGLVFALACTQREYGAPAHAIGRQFEALLREFGQAPEMVSLCTTAAQIEAAHAEGKIGAVISMEGGEGLEGDLDLLHVYHRLGLRMLGPVWFWKNDLGDGTWEETQPGGLTQFGRQVIREMGKLRIILDTAHMPPRTFFQALEVAEGPVVNSHSGARNVVNTGEYGSRNIWDDQIRAIAQTGGVLGIPFCKDMLDNMEAAIPDLMRFFTHVAELVGPEHVGFGSDYDGGTRPPAGLEDISGVPRLTSALIDVGFSEPEILGILGGNFVRVFRQVWGA